MRKQSLVRKTKETEITASICLDGNGTAEVNTGIGFFDHMLTALAAHSGMDISVQCKGDLHVDGHHTIEDTGIVIGTLLNKLLEDKKGIARYACAYVPMDEALSRCVVDVSGRAYLSYNADNLQGMIGGYDFGMTIEFFRAICTNAMITVHLDVIRGNNLHHVCESLFKAFARAMGDAVKITSDKVLSTKGTL